MSLEAEQGGGPAFSGFGVGHARLLPQSLGMGGQLRCLLGYQVASSRFVELRTLCLSGAGTQHRARDVSRGGRR